MILVGPILRHHFNLCSAGTPELSVIRVGGDAHFLDGFFIWGDNRSATPIQAVYGHAVDLKAIGRVALTIGIYLHLVFGLEDAAGTCGPPGP